MSRKEPSPPPGDPGYKGPPQFRPTPPPAPPAKRFDGSTCIAIGDRMKISVALIKDIAEHDPEGFTTQTVRVSRIDTEQDGTKTLWMERL